MRFLYTLLFYLLIPFVFLRLLWRARKTPAYAKRWQERFGVINNFPVLKESIWIHAVSLGEVLAAAPLIKTLQTQYPTVSIVVTTLTPTGSERVTAIFNQSVYHVYAPYDLPFAIKRFLNHIKPKLLIIIETEIWPNIIHLCAQSKVPILLANGRLSAQSAKGYSHFSQLTSTTLSHITRLAVQTQIEAERFIQLGMNPAKTTVTGNIKFDIELPIHLAEQAATLKYQWGETRPVWIAASTHKGEDEIILQALKLISQQLPDIMLILVPRHPERFNEVALLCEQQGFSLSRRSLGQPIAPTTTIFLGDTLGELLLFYQAANIAFVGGSLVPVGGHNTLEPAALKIPVLTGPHTFNFQLISELLQTAGGQFTINNAQQIADKVIELLSNPDALKIAGEAALQVVANNKGALQKHLALIAAIIAQKVN